MQSLYKKVALLPNAGLIAGGNSTCWDGNKKFDEIAHRLTQFPAQTGKLSYSGTPSYTGLPKRDGVHFVDCDTVKDRLAAMVCNLLEINNVIRNIKRVSHAIQRTSLGVPAIGRLPDSRTDTPQTHDRAVQQHTDFPSHGSRVMNLIREYEGREHTNVMAKAALIPPPPSQTITNTR